MSATMKTHVRRTSTFLNQNEGLLAAVVDVEPGGAPAKGWLARLSIDNRIRKSLNAASIPSRQDRTSLWKRPGEED